MNNLLYADFLRNRYVSVLENMEFDKPRTTHPKPAAGEVCVPVYHGFFKERAVMAGGERTYFVYIPTRHPASGPQVMIFVDDGQSAPGLLVNTPWVDIAEEQGFALMVLEPEGGRWDLENPLEKELPYIEAAHQLVVDRNLYSVNETGAYAVGYGAGGTVGQIYGAENCSGLSGYVAVGGREVPAGLLESIGSQVSAGDPVGRMYGGKDMARIPAGQQVVCKREVPLPVWLVEMEEPLEDSLAYWKRVNRAGTWSENEYGDVYSADIAALGSYINEQPVQQVWHTRRSHGLEKFLGESRTGQVRAIWQFLRRVKRHAGITSNGSLRPRKTWQELGMRRYTDVIAGRAREWYVYVPSAHRKHPEERLPLVVAIHGYSCCGELFMGDSEWYKVAEERGFFVLFASAAVGGRMLGGRTCNVPLPMWNSQVPQLPEGNDDMAYFSHVIRRTEEEFPVDSRRRFVTGHSNGSMMTQCLLIEMTDIFAGFAPVGAIYNELYPESPVPAFKGRHGAPVWLMKGTFDIGCKADMSPGSTNRNMVEFCCRENGIDPEQIPVERTNGRFRNYTYVDGNGYPRVIFTELIGYPHAYTPEVSWMVWDGFFSHLVREEDGTVRYLV